MVDIPDAGHHPAWGPLSLPPTRPTLADAERIAEIQQLLATFDSARPAEMSPLFYEHGYWELYQAVEDLLRILGRDLDDRPPR